LGRGTVQKQAIDELAALPANHPFRKVTLELLYNLQKNLNINQQIETDDRELVMRLAPLYQEDREKARQEGRQQGQQLGEQQIILRLLNRRFGGLGLSVIEQIQGLSIDELESLGDVLLDFSEVGDLEVWLREKASQQ
jgi:predicted transposase/invertase (TIGR01784 family)